MIVKSDIRVIASVLAVEPQTFGKVKDREDLKEQLIECIKEQCELHVVINEYDLDAFYEMMKDDGSVEEV